MELLRSVGDIMKWNEKMVRLRGSKTVDEVADAISASPDTYMAYERGDREPMPRVKEDIAKYFSVKVSDIW